MELGTARLHVLQQAIFVEGGRHSEACGTGERVASVRTGVVARSEHVALVLAAHGSNRHPASQGLGAGEHVWLHGGAKVLVRPQCARAAHARLHLVAHHQRARLVAQRPHGLEELGGARSNAPLSLQRLHHDGRQSTTAALLGLLLQLSDHLSQPSGVIVGYVLKSRGEWAEVRLVLGLARGSYGSQRAPMKGVERSNNHRMLNA
mmetsp:Transcript_2649/g.4105  ORF Transcript_2649/g.4105 Transcript_2649/m.4105 type:complete len:205 (+) Transcript_2649:424-1038(+)